MTISFNVRRLDSRTDKYSVSNNGRPLSVAELFRLLRSDRDSRRQLCDVLRRSRFEAYYLEFPPFGTIQASGQSAEFVVVDAPGFVAMAPDGRPFSEHFAKSRASTVVFENLSGDARLVVPTPLGPPEVYPHLAPFLREADHDQIDDFIDTVARVAIEFGACDEGPELRWLSTAGGGVSWLHIRFDRSPKYYKHAPYQLRI